MMHYINSFTQCNKMVLSVLSTCVCTYTHAYLPKWATAVIYAFGRAGHICNRKQTCRDVNDACMYDQPEPMEIALVNAHSAMFPWANMMAP